MGDYLVAGTNPVEGGTYGAFNIMLDNPAPAGGLIVNFDTLGGTATFGTDYTLKAGENISDVTANTFTIAAGASTATLNLAAVSDSVADPGETVSVNLTPGAGYLLAKSTVIFADKVDHTTGLSPHSVSVGDFNNDGKTDLAVANSDSHSVSVFLRNATNTGFDAKVDYATNPWPESVIVADFNNDGKDDLAVSSESDNKVSVLLRNASNTGFDAKVDYTTGSSPYSVIVGDFNNDGKIDLVTANYSSDSVSVFLRNASNTGFNPKVDYTTGSYPFSVTVGDFNNDGKTDLAVANMLSYTVSVLLRNTTNTGFEDKIDYPIGQHALSVSAEISTMMAKPI